VFIVQLIRERAKSQPDQPAYIPYFAGEAVTYRALIEQADQIASWLLRRGCRPRQRCGLKFAEGAGFLTHALGVLAAGLCLVPINPNWSIEDQEFVIDKAGLDWLLTAESRLIRYPFGRPVDTNKDRHFAAVSPAYIRFTSGTTGLRKAVLLGHPTIIERLNAADEIFKITSRDVIWFQLPMVDHFVASTLLYLSRGATIVTASSANSELFPDLLRTWKPSICYAPPSFYETLVEQPDLDLTSLRLIISTTALLSAKTRRSFTNRFQKALNPALGIIEVGIVTLNTRADRPDSVGTPSPAYRVTLIGENGQPSAVGEPGELCVQGPGLLDAYLNPWRPRAEILSPHGYKTGDYARQDEDGMIYLLGRSKNRIMVNGVSFFYEQVEEVLNAAPGVRETRVVLEEGELVAEVVGSPPAIAQLPEIARAVLDPRIVPKRFRQVATLPRTPNGKLLR
jgi:long-chain acyl-CoA synthetase